jgi:hypothetical protein
LGAVCAGLYPNLIHVQFPSSKYIEMSHGVILKDHQAKDLKYYSGHGMHLSPQKEKLNFAI